LHVAAPPVRLTRSMVIQSHPVSFAQATLLTWGWNLVIRWLCASTGQLLALCYIPTADAGARPEGQWTLEGETQAGSVWEPPADMGVLSIRHTQLVVGNVTAAGVQQLRLRATAELAVGAGCSVPAVVDFLVAASLASADWCFQSPASTRPLLRERERARERERESERERERER
jgi:hypothetical protein